MIEVTLHHHKELVPVDETGQTFREADVIAANATDGDTHYGFVLVLPEEATSPEALAAFDEVATMSARTGLERHLAALA